MLRIMLGFACVVLVFSCRNQSPTNSIVEIEPSASTPVGITGQVESPVSTPGDTFTVSFEDTEIKLMNTSGGTLLGVGKPVVIETDWNVRLINPDGADVSLDDWPDDLWVWADMHIECASGQQSYTYTNNPHFGERTAKNIRWTLTPSYGAYHFINNTRLRASRWRIAWDDHEGNEWTGGMPHTAVHFMNCTDLQARLMVEAGRRTESVVIAENTVFPMPETAFFQPPKIDITYHAIVPDSSMASEQRRWLSYIIADRFAFADRINGMLPVYLDALNHVEVGPSLVVPPLPDTPPYDPYRARPICEDDESGIMWRAIEQLKGEYPNDNSSSSTIHLHVGILGDEAGTRDVAKHYCQDVSAVGRGYIGGPWSVFRYKPLNGSSFGPEETTLIHEIGHNLGLPHTTDDPNYPGYPGRINMDAFLIDEIPRRIIRIPWQEAPPLMGSSSWDNSWLSEYNWNRIADIHSGQPSSVFARRIGHVNHTGYWTCNH